MLVNLKIIRSKVNYRTEHVCGNINHKLLFRDVRALTLSQENDYKSRYIYLCSWPVVPKLKSLPEYLICIGGGEKAMKFFSERGITALIYPEAMDGAVLLSEIQEVFNHYYDLTDEYKRLLFHQHTMRKILSCCADFFENFCFLIDAEYNLLEMSSNYLPENSENEALDVIQRAENRLRGFNKNTSIVRIKAENDDPELCISRFFDGNESLAILIVAAPEGGMPEYTEHLVQYISNMLQLCVSARYSSVTKVHNYIRSAISFITSGREIDSKTLEQNLLRIGWKSDDSFRLAYIRIRRDSRRNSFAVQGYNRYESLFPDSIASVNNESVIILIHNITKSVLDSTLDNLKAQMETNNMECCISIPFVGFMQLKTHFDILSSAIDLGEPSENVIMYKTIMQKDLVLRVNSSIPLMPLVHPAALKLREYDRKNGTRLLYTLEQYILNNKSLKSSAEALFIHKNTLIYRLNCITKITDLSIENQSEQLFLLLSCIVLRNLKDKS